MNIGLGCYQTRIFKNRFFDLAQGALAVKSTHDMQNGKLIQITRETNISHNVFDGCGHGGGITFHVVHALQTTISNNYFKNSGRPYTLNIGGGGVEGNLSGDYLVEYNHFDDVQHDADDAGVIVVNGMSFNSSVRHNIIHGVHRGFFSDNVAFWFDNMSTDWTVKNNIYYDLEQGDMKTCGTYMIDNDYSNNFVIEPPVNPPEKFIEGQPEFRCSNLRISFEEKPAGNQIHSGSVVKIMADVYNQGSSGVAPIPLYINRKIVTTKPFPVIRNNSRTVEFNIRLNEIGSQEIGIAETQPRTIIVTGKKPDIVFDDLQLSEERLLLGQRVSVKAKATNIHNRRIQKTIKLYANKEAVMEQEIKLGSDASKEILFSYLPEAGDFLIGIGNSDLYPLKVMKGKDLNIRQQDLHTYISPKAKPAEVKVNQEENKYMIKASGWDFYHAEDAYATVYLKKLIGDFISTVKITSFQHRTNEWFRAGLFVRNDISKSFDVERGSKGSVLMFSTPGRAGINYDEFGDGCMHKANSENLPEDTPTPIWIRLERHGNRFTGYISLDGENWIIKRQTKEIPGINETIDLGLAAGSSDNEKYFVEFADWEIRVEDK
jgi:regulation of enolase protein 1 (concanavalin A-like superfamily)